jgi:outer membrane usher protein
MVLRQRAALSLTLNRNLGDQPTTNVFLSFTMAIGARRSATLSAVGGQGNSAQSNELYATVQQNPPVGPGGGYRLGAATSGNYDSDVRWNFPVGDIELQAARNQGLDGQSALWNGAATLLGGELRAARAVTGSFAVVDVGGIADVPVYVDHQLITHTDSHGRALLPNMRAYEPNRINIEPLELPLDTSIGARTMVLAPAFRSGVVARFPVVRERGVVFRLVDDNGRDVPAGAMVLFQKHSFPVALDGQAYVTGYDAAGAGVARWGAHECYLQLPAPPANDPLPDLGIVPCHTPPATPVAAPVP